jgi:hypothetical protein
MKFQDDEVAGSRESDFSLAPADTIEVVNQK